MNEVMNTQGSYLETLAQPGEVTSIAVGRFFTQSVEALVLAKRTILSIFNFNDKTDNFEFTDHINVYRQIYSLHASSQPHSLDCLLVMTINGEWLFLQWNEGVFFPLGAGKILDAIQPVIHTPEIRRFRLDPTFQWVLSMVPLSDDTPRFFTKPRTVNGTNQSQIINQNLSTNQNNNNLANSTTDVEILSQSSHTSSIQSQLARPIPRISFRAICAVDETVFIGLQYDGPDATFLNLLKQNPENAFSEIGQEYGINKWKDNNVEFYIKNGLQDEWGLNNSIGSVGYTIFSPKQNPNPNSAQSLVQKVCLAHAETFIFMDTKEIDEQGTDQQINYTNQSKSIIEEERKGLYDIMYRVRHMVFTSSIHLPLFPFPPSRNVNNSNLNISQGHLSSGVGINDEIQVDLQSQNNSIRSDEDYNQVIMPSFKYQQSLTEDNYLPIPPYFDNSSDDDLKIRNKKPKQKRDQSKIRSEKYEFDDETIDSNIQASNCLCKVTSLALIDTAPATNIFSLIFDFYQRRVSMHNFVLASMPPSTSRLMIIDNTCLEGLMEALGNNITVEQVALINSGNVQRLRESFVGTNDFKRHLPHSFDSQSSQNQSYQETEKEFSYEINEAICMFQRKSESLYITFSNDSNQLSQKINTNQLSNPSNSTEINQQVRFQQLIEQRSKLKILLKNLITSSNSNMNQSHQSKGSIADDDQWFPSGVSFMAVCSHAVRLFIQGRKQVILKFPTPFLDPPMAVQYVRGMKDLPVLGQDLERRHHKHSHKHIGHIPKLFVASTCSIISIIKGVSQKQVFPDHFLREFVFATGARYILSDGITDTITNNEISTNSGADTDTNTSSAVKHKHHHTHSHQKQSKVLSQQIQIRPNSVNGRIIQDGQQQGNDITNAHKDQMNKEQNELKYIRERGTAVLFVLSSTSIPLMINLDSGKFIDIPGGEDFACNPSYLQSIINIPGSAYGQTIHHTTEESIAAALGSGRSGAMEIVQVGHQLQSLAKGQWLERVISIFSSKIHSESTVYQLLLIVEDMPPFIDIQQGQQQQQGQQVGIQQQTQFNQQQVGKPQQVNNTVQQQQGQGQGQQQISQGAFFHRGYTGQLYSLKKNSVDTIDASQYGIDIMKRTLTLDGGEGVLIQVTTGEVRAVPTVKYTIDKIQNPTQTNNQSGNNNNSHSSHKGNVQQVLYSIHSEESGPKVDQGLMWSAPMLLTLEQCQQLQQQKKRFQWHAQNMKRAEFDHACVTDNMIAVSVQRVVYVLVWFPAKAMQKPKDTKDRAQSPKSSQKDYIKQDQVLCPVATLYMKSPVTSISACTIYGRAILLIGTDSPPMVYVFRLDRIAIATNSEKERIKKWDKIESIRKSMRASELFNTVSRPFTNNVLQVNAKFLEIAEGSGLYLENLRSNEYAISSLFHININDTPNSILLSTFGGRVKFQKNNIEQHRQKKRQQKLDAKMNEDIKGNKIDNDNKNKNIDKDDCTVNSEVVNSLIISNDDDFDDDLDSSCSFINIQEEDDKMLTTLEGKIPFLDPIEQKSYRYYESEGAVLLIGGRCAEVTCGFLPLMSLLESKPVNINPQNNQQGDGIYINQVGNKYEEEQIQRRSFLFPPPLTYVWQGRTTVNFIGDGEFVYSYGERAFVITWRSLSMKLKWVPLSCSGGIHTMVPMRVIEQQRSKTKKSKNKELLQKITIDGSEKNDDLQAIIKSSDKLNSRDDGYENQQGLLVYSASTSSLALTLASDIHNDSNILNSEVKDQDAQTGKANTKLQPQYFPTLAWVGQIERFLQFGAVDLRRQILRQTKELPSQPRSIAYLPALSAIAVLCREHSYYPNYIDINKDEKAIENEGKGKKMGDTREKPGNQSINNIFKEDNKLKHETDSQYHYDSAELDTTGLGFDLSGITHIGRERDMPFRELFMHTIRKQKNQSTSASIQSNSRSQSPSLQTNLYVPTKSSFLSPIVQLNQLKGKDTSIQQKKKKISQRKNKNRIQIHKLYFDSASPPSDIKGIIFDDLASDWFAEHHSKYQRDYRPVRRLLNLEDNDDDRSSSDQDDIQIDIRSDDIMRPPSKRKKLIINKRQPALCYGPNVAYCHSFPRWITKDLAVSALIHNCGRLHETQSCSVYVSQTELMKTQTFNQRQNSSSINNDIELEKVQQLNSLPQSPQQQVQQLHSLSLSQPVPLSISQTQVQEQPSNMRQIVFGGQSAENIFHKYSSSFMILLFDEADMRMRIGEVNLSHMNVTEINKYGEEIIDNSMFMNPNKNSQLKQNSSSTAAAVTSLASRRGKNNIFENTNSGKGPGLISKTNSQDENINNDINSLISTQLYNFFLMTCVTVPTYDGFREISRIEHELINQMNEDLKQGLDIKTSKLNIISQGNDYNPNNYSNNLISEQQQYKSGIVGFDDREKNQNQKDQVRNQEFLNQAISKHDVRPLGWRMNVEELNQRYTRSLLCVAGRESTFGVPGMEAFSKNQQQTPKRDNETESQQGSVNSGVEGEVSFESLYTDIFIFEVTREFILGEARNAAVGLFDEMLLQEDQQSKGTQNVNVISSTNTKEDAIHQAALQQVMKKVNVTPFTFPLMATAPVTSDRNANFLLNVRIILLKRIRIIGGVQGLQTQPSILVALNGRAALFFGFGPRFSDQVAFALREDADENKKQKIQVEKEKNQLQIQQQSTENQSNNKDDQFIDDQICSCTLPFYTTDGKLAPLAPYHMTISNVRNKNDITNLDDPWTQLSKSRAAAQAASVQLQGNSNVTSPPLIPASPIHPLNHQYMSRVGLRPIHTYSPTAPFAFRVQLVSYLIAPAPITAFTMLSGFIRCCPQVIPQKVQPHPPFDGISSSMMMHQHILYQQLIPSHLQIAHSTRCLLAFAPCGFAISDLHVEAGFPLSLSTTAPHIHKCISNPIVMKQWNIQKYHKSENDKHQQLLLTRSTTIAQETITTSQPKIELPSLSLMPLANSLQNIQANQQIHSSQKTQVPTKSRFITHHQLDNRLRIAQQAANKDSLTHQRTRICFTASQVGTGLFMRIQSYAPSLIVDANLLNHTTIGIIADNEALIYSILPNPKFEGDNIYITRNNAQNITLPLCAVLVSRSPQITHMSFILPTNQGNSLPFSGLRRNILKRLSRLMQKMKNEKDHELQFEKQSHIEEANFESEAVAAEQQIIQLQNNINHTQIQNDQKSISSDNTTQEITLLTEKSRSNRQICLLLREQRKERENNLRIIEMGISVLTNKVSDNKNSLNFLPSVPPFTLYTRFGHAIRSTPIDFDQIPYSEIVVENICKIIQQMNFGGIWRNRQTDLVVDYDKTEEEMWRNFVRNEARRELEKYKTYSLPIAQTNSIYNQLTEYDEEEALKQLSIELKKYYPPPLGLRYGRCLDSELLFGISPLPITSEFVKFKCFKYQQIKDAIGTIRKRLLERAKWRFEERKRILNEFQSQKLSKHELKAMPVHRISHISLSESRQGPQSHQEYIPQLSSSARTASNLVVKKVIRRQSLPKITTIKSIIQGDNVSNVAESSSTSATSKNKQKQSHSRPNSPQVPKSKTQYPSNTNLTLPLKVSSQQDDLTFATNQDSKNKSLPQIIAQSQIKFQQNLQQHQQQRLLFGLNKVPEQHQQNNQSIDLQLVPLQDTHIHQYNYNQQNDTQLKHLSPQNRDAQSQQHNIQRSTTRHINSFQQQSSNSQHTQNMQSISGPLTRISPNILYSSHNPTSQYTSNNDHGYKHHVHSQTVQHAVYSATPMFNSRSSTEDHDWGESHVTTQNYNTQPASHFPSSSPSPTYLDDQNYPTDEQSLGFVQFPNMHMKDQDSSSSNKEDTNQSAQYEQHDQTNI